MIEQEDSVRTNLLVAIREIPKRRGAVIIIGSVLVGLALARFVMISPTAGVVAVSAAAVGLTVLLQKTDHLIVAWFVSTTFVWLILFRLLPTHYHSFVGRGIFWGLLICIMGAWAIDKTLSKGQMLPFDNLPLKATIVCFLLCCILSLFTSVNLFISVKKLFSIVVALTASYVFYDLFSRDVNNIKKFFKIISFMVAILSLFTVCAAGMAYISGEPIYKRIQLWFWNPNVLGSLLFISTPLLITCGFDFRPVNKLKPFFLFLLLLSLLFSFHRTSWLAASVSGIFLLWKSRMKIPMSAAIIIMIFLAGLLTPAVGGDVYDHITGERYSGRKEIWQAAWNTACDYPVLGTGIGNTVGSIDKYIETPWLKSQQTHNVFLQNAVEMGFVSPVILLAFYMIFFYFSKKIEKELKSHYLKLVVRGTVAAFVGLFVHGMFGNFGILVAFDASEFHVLLPYLLLVLPFAAKKLEERGAAVLRA